MNPFEDETPSTKETNINITESCPPDNIFEVETVKETNINITESETPTSNWYDEFEEDYRKYAAKNNWMSPKDSIKSHMELEKLFEADKLGKTVLIPGDDDDEDTYNSFYNKLGRPEDFNEYGLDELFKDYPGYNKPDMDLYSKMLHSAGLNKKQAVLVANEYNRLVKEKQDEIMAKYTDDFKIFKQDMANREILKDASNGYKYLDKEINLNPKEVDVIAMILGDERATKLFGIVGTIGKEMGHIKGEKEISISGKDAAKKKYDELMSNGEFTTKMARNDLESINKINELIEIIAS